MSLTTTGHVDIIPEDAGEDWEVGEVGEGLCELAGAEIVVAALVALGRSELAHICVRAAAQTSTLY